MVRWGIGYCVGDTMNCIRKASVFVLRDLYRRKWTGSLMHNLICRGSNFSSFLLGIWETRLAPLKNVYAVANNKGGKGTISGWIISPYSSQIREFIVHWERSFLEVHQVVCTIEMLEQISSPCIHLMKSGTWIQCARCWISHDLPTEAEVPRLGYLLKLTCCFGTNN
jgi:hypothetical protein